MRNLQHFFGRGRFFSIVLPPNERKILVHFDVSGSCRSLDIDYLGALELGANDRLAGLSDCPSEFAGNCSEGLVG